MKSLKVIDLFAGAGGFSTGATQAGANVVWAANHWQDAVKFHTINHPQTQHVCQDLHQADWSQVPEHDIVLASPCCQGHSRAKGAQGKSIDQSRSTAWAVVSACEFHRPRFFVVENVKEFLGWALYPSWRDAMQRMGYRITENTLNAQTFGVPQSRERVFLIGSLDQEVEIQDPGKALIPARSIIQWSEGAWAPIETTLNGKPRSQAILSQVKEGRKVHGDEFMVAYYGNEKQGRSLDKPLGTLTTRDRFAVVRGDQMRFLTKEEVRIGMGFPKEYAIPKQKKLAVHMLGNAVCPPVAREITKQLIEVA